MPSSAVGHLLQRHSSLAQASPIPPKRVSMVAIKLRYLIEAIVCVEIEARTLLALTDNHTAQLGDSTSLPGRQEESIGSHMGSWWR